MKLNKCYKILELLDVERQGVGGQNMVEIIAGEKGKGKTKYLLEKVNNSVQTVTGILYILIKVRNICMN